MKPNQWPRHVLAGSRWPSGASSTRETRSCSLALLPSVASRWPPIRLMGSGCRWDAAASSTRNSLIRAAIVTPSRNAKPDQRARGLCWRSRAREPVILIWGERTRITRLPGKRAVFLEVPDTHRSPELLTGRAMFELCVPPYFPLEFSGFIKPGMIGDFELRFTCFRRCRLFLADEPISGVRHVYPIFELTGKPLVCACVHRVPTVLFREGSPPSLPPPPPPPPPSLPHSPLSFNPPNSLLAHAAPAKLGSTAVPVYVRVCMRVHVFFFFVFLLHE